MENQEYIKSIVEKFNTNPKDEDLNPTERILIQKVVDVEKQVVELYQQVNTLSEEIQSKQNQVGALNQQILLGKGQSQAFIDSLLALRG